MSDLSASLIGTWALIKTEAMDEHGLPMPAPYGGAKAIGRATFNGDGRMMAVLIDGREAAEIDGTREYTSYCGDFTFVDGKLVTRVDAASEPARLGTDQVRNVSFDGDTMTLQPPVRIKQGRQEHRRLSWRKISDV